MYQSKTIVLAKRPEGEPKSENFRLETHPVRELQKGEFLIKVLWLSMDPYMRPRMDDRESYKKPVPIGGMMPGESVGEIIASRSEQYQVGDIVTAYTGWQSHHIGREGEAQLRKVNPAGLSPTVFLGPAGMPGRTAYFGLLRVGMPKAGETVVVSAASGAVGSVVGQIARYLGCYAVGIAGGEEKCRYVTEELGFDACVDYKADAFPARLASVCDKGIDVYFENVGGAVTHAVAPLLNKGARVPVCGFVATYNDMDKSETPFDVLGALSEPPEHRFFLVSEWNAEYGPATEQLLTWIKDGVIRYRETVTDGLENAPKAFLNMLRGTNTGKQLVKVA